MRARWLKLAMNLWPPYRGAGIRVTEFADDYRSAEVRLRMGRLNRNYIGTHFGGSLYGMTDPFYFLMLSHLMGRAYRIAHAGARLEFLAPATGTVTARFEVSEERVKALQARAGNGERHLEEFPVEVKDGKGEVVARIVHIIYIRLKEAPASQ
ncbi:MAG TPA: DUF4442 domain-containing protein [Burkholderiales bacterium]|nr:DUF4442 domain-containing protein [Burkholderiales bacterium]